ncbi:hypothetical protein [Vibrio splendidus]|uniref:hypothetical protein n=1 Tax=Vibrio splendidus TaxID=29497 RepID=UPI000CC2E7AB|nr:hypothetical protein [Vibrio splendidus]PMN27972.1 hypothetical protein BCT36_25470 [Vibrio splendidus]
MSNEIFRISYFRDGSDEFMNLLSESLIDWNKRNKFPYGTIVASSELIEVLKVIGGASIIPSLAAVIIAWIKRNESREIIVKLPDFRIVQLKGCTKEEVIKILELSSDMTIIQTKPDERS